MASSGEKNDAPRDEKPKARPRKKVVRAPAPPPAPAGPPLYELRGVGRAFATGATTVHAVAGVDLDIYPGEVVALEGPSGSGKTTLLQILGALDRATEGTVRFAEHDLEKSTDKELTEMRANSLGFVFQAFNLIPTLSAAENVEAAMIATKSNAKTRRARATELLARVGLAERAEHLPSRLSGGEQQRVAIARALANGPRVILADEPTGNLDSATAEDVVGVLRRMAAEQGVTIILVTHAEEVARHADRRFKLRDGRLAADAS